MNKNVYLIAAISGMIGTGVVAAHHELGWTILGAASVWCNLWNYINGDNREGD